MKKILIVGSKSFIGKNYAEFSKHKKIDEVSLLEKRPEDIDFRGYDVVLHLAAIVHQTRFISEEEYMHVNSDLCICVAENAKKAGITQFVFLSSLKVYGEKTVYVTLPNEHSVCFPSDSYGRSKYAAEKGLEKLADNNFIVSIVRTPLVYGRGVKANMMSLVKLIDHFSVLPLGGLNNKRNFTYSENLVGFIDKIIEKKTSGIFIAKDEGTLSTTELAILMARALNKKIFLFRIPKLLIKIGIFVFPTIFERLFGSLEVCNEETKKVLNYIPPVSSEVGIERMVKYYIAHKNDRI